MWRMLYDIAFITGGSCLAPEIRPFNLRRHLNDVLDFQTEVYEVNFPGFRMNSQFIRHYTDDLRRAVGHPSEGLFVLEDEDGACGFLWVALIVTLTDPCVGYIKNIYVAPRLRGQRFGVELLNYAEYWCKQQGVMYISLDASCCNDTAVQLYLKHGYNITRYRMEKPLKSGQDILA